MRRSIRRNPSRKSLARVAIAASALAISSGCVERGLRPVNPCTRSSVSQRIQVTNVDEVDLLFMIDDSVSMAQEQANLAEQIPRLVRILSEGDRDEDGVQDFQPVRSLHVGVVSSNMGAGHGQDGEAINGCAGLGDDGVLQHATLGSDACAPASYRSAVFAFEAGGAESPEDFAARFGCIAQLGTGGCGLEQQLESPLKALSPSSAQSWTRSGYTPPRFVGNDYQADGSWGRGLEPNFLRPNSALAIVLVTDEEDCSVTDGSLHALYTPETGNTLCHTHRDPAEGLLTPIDRYVNGFLGLRRDPSLLIFSGIVGIPTTPEAGALLAEGDYGGLLSLEGMTPVTEVDPDSTRGYLRVRPSCEFENAEGVSFGEAAPPVRIVQTAAALDAAGAGVSLSSICSDDFGPAIDGVIEKIADALGGACLPRALNADADGFVECEVLELLPAEGTPGATTDCMELEGRSFDSLVTEDDGTTRQLCRVTQVGPEAALSNAAAGWYYDDASDEVARSCGETGQRIAFTDVAPPATGSEVRLECLQVIALGVEASTEVSCDDESGPCRLGMFCSLEADRCGTGTSLPNGAGATLSCDPVERLCVVPCSTDASCAEAGLLGYVCDVRTNAEAAGASAAMSIAPELLGDVRGVCINPTCN
jgi:hypothetical protein